MKPTNCVTMMSGPGVVSAMPEAVQHLARPEPAIGTDRLLGNIGKHGIGAAKGDDRHLAEEQGYVAEHIAAAERDQEEGDRSQPEHQKDGSNLERPSRGRSRMGGRVLAERRIGIGDLLVADLLVAIAGKKGGQTSAPTDEPDDPRDQDDQRKWRVEKEDRDEGRRRDTPIKMLLLSARLPTRTTASSTIASTAALRPKNMACTTPTLPKAA